MPLIASCLASYGANKLAGFVRHQTYKPKPIILALKATPISCSFRMSKEGDVLQKMTPSINDTISTQSNATRFGEVMYSAGFVSDHMVQGVVTKNDSQYNKVSQIMSAVRAQITTFGNPTEKFNKFVLLLHGKLELKALALELVEKLSKPTRLVASYV